MTQFLPPNLLALFAAREPIPYLPPGDRLPCEKHGNNVDSKNYHGLGDVLKRPNFTWERPEEAEPSEKHETRTERRERRKREKEEQAAYKLEQEIALWNPLERENVTEDPFKTLFVSRLNYDTSESKISREFGHYGPIKSIKMVMDANTGKPRGYCFIQYEHERDMHTAYKQGDGAKIDGRRVLVDVERGRTVKGWLCRRLGGGLGATRRTGGVVNSEDSSHRTRHVDSRNRSPRRRSRSRERRFRSPPRAHGGESRRDRRREKSPRIKRKRSSSPAEFIKSEDGSEDYRTRRHRSRDRSSRRTSKERRYATKREIKDDPDDSKTDNYASSRLSTIVKKERNFDDDEKVNTFRENGKCVGNGNANNDY